MSSGHRRRAGWLVVVVALVLARDARTAPPQARVPSRAAPGDACAARDDVIALRASTPEQRTSLRTWLVEEVGHDAGRARGCRAAVAAQAAVLDHDDEAAATLWAIARDALPELAGVLEAHRALSLGRLGDVDGARASLVHATPSARMRARIDAALARASHDDVGWLRAQERIDDAAAHAALCDAGRATSCARLWTQHARSDAALAREATLDVTGWSASAMTARIDALVKVARPARAVLEGKQWWAAHDDVRGAARDAFELAFTTALVRAHDAAAALALLDARVDSRGDARGDDSAGDVLWRQRAWALGKAGRAVDASHAWSALAARTGDTALRAEARFFAGFALYDGAAVDATTRDARDAGIVWAEGDDAMRGSTWEPLSLWYRALLELAAGHTAAALPVLDDLVTRFGSDREARKHRYWRAVALHDLHRTTEAAHEWQALVRADPVDWYGLLARRRLGPPLAGTHVARDALAQHAADDDDARTARLLWALGFDEEAHAMVRARTKIDARLVGLAQQVDDAHRGWQLGARFMPHPAAGATALRGGDGWRASYAAPWPDVVEREAARAGIAPSFAWAIMRTESGFDAGAISVAGAQGVIQLMPSAARGAATLRGDDVDAARIFEPENAIALGATLLGVWNKEFGATMLAAAAYNGGPDNVVTWLRRFSSLPKRDAVELFVERVPFRETRDYIKRVLAVEATYRALDGAPLALDLPTTLPTPPASVTVFPVDE